MAYRAVVVAVLLAAAAALVPPPSRAAAGPGSAARGPLAPPVRLEAAKKPTDTVVVPPDYNVPIGFTLAGAGIAAKSLVFGVPIAVFGLFMFRQAGKVRFVLDSKALEVQFYNARKRELKTGGLNFATGTDNRWNYSSFTDWGFLPSKDFPVLVYFFETQTESKFERGQFHLFPVLMNGRKLYETMKDRIPVGGGK